jgi:hypothetical protein
LVRFGAARRVQLETADDQVAGVLHRVHRTLEALFQRAELLVGDAVVAGPEIRPRKGAEELPMRRQHPPQARTPRAAVRPVLAGIRDGPCSTTARLRSGRPSLRSPTPRAGSYHDPIEQRCREAFRTEAADPCLGALALAQLLDHLQRSRDAR